MLTALGVFFPAITGAFVSIRGELRKTREAVSEVHTIVNGQRAEMATKITQLESLLAHATGEVKELRTLWQSEHALDVKQPSPSVEMRADSIVPGAGTQKE